MLDMEDRKGFRRNGKKTDLRKSSFRKTVIKSFEKIGVSASTD